MKRKRTPKARKSGERRYPEGKYPVYDQAYDQALKNSIILTSNVKHVNNQFRLEHPESALLELEGDPSKDHYYKMPDEWRLAAIPMYRKELKDIKRRFRSWQREQVRSGQALTPPKNWPEPLLNLRLSKEALYDVRCKEAIQIKKTIADKKAKEEEKRKQNILPNGPLMVPDSNRTQDREQNPSFDGQKISYNSEGVPYVNEPASPYHRMSLFHYKQMSAEWMEKMGLTQKALISEREKLFENARKEAVKNGKQPPAKKLGFKRLKKEKLASITKKDFPEWPEGAEPIE